MARDCVTAARAALALAAVLAMAGCSGSSTDKKAELGCPSLIRAPGADTIAVFAPSGHAAKDVIVAGKIRGLDSDCVREKVGVTLNAKITFYAQRATNDVPDTALPYFVALVDPEEHVISQEAFQIPIHFLPGESYRIMPDEKISVTLPVKTQGAGGAYAVIVGFQLTPEQLAFNRAQRAQQ